MAKPIRHYPCPACGSPLNMDSSRMITALSRQQYAKCSNAMCGGAFLIRSEIISQTSPTGDLFAQKTKLIPQLGDDKNNLAMDLAIEFLGRKWKSQLTDDEKIIECREYLQDNLQISINTADVIIRRALAVWNAAGYEKWGIDTDSPLRTSIVLNEGIKNQHIISLDELVRLVQARENQKLI